MEVISAEARHAQITGGVFSGYDAHWLQILIELELAEICWARDLKRARLFFFLSLWLTVKQLLDAAPKFLELAVLELVLTQIWG